MADFVGAFARLGITLLGAKIKRQILPGAPRLARAREHHNLDVVVIGHDVERFVHVRMERRAHRVAFFRAVENNPADPVFLFHLDVIKRFHAGHGGVLPVCC